MAAKDPQQPPAPGSKPPPPPAPPPAPGSKPRDPFELPPLPTPRSNPPAPPSMAGAMREVIDELYIWLKERRSDHRLSGSFTEGIRDNEIQCVIEKLDALVAAKIGKWSDTVNEIRTSPACWVFVSERLPNKPMSIVLVGGWNKGGGCAWRALASYDGGDNKTWSAFRDSHGGDLSPAVWWDGPIPMAPDFLGPNGTIHAGTPHRWGQPAPHAPLNLPADRSKQIQRATDADDGACSTISPKLRSLADCYPATGKGSEDLNDTVPAGLKISSDRLAHHLAVLESDCEWRVSEIQQWLRELQAEFEQQCLLVNEFMMGAGPQHSTATEIRTMQHAIDARLAFLRRPQRRRS